MQEARTAHIRYVFFDVVAFTKGRTVEAQADIVACINSVSRAALKSRNVKPFQRILVPTGDGICIALLGTDKFDLHLQLALDLLRLIQDENAKTNDASRQFQVRIGINENTDNIVSDVNGRRNVAGNGVSHAQRVMDFADGGQVLASRSVYEILKGRERYFNAFRSFTGEGKHSEAIPVYQYVSKSPGLNTNAPTRFAIKEVPKPKLTAEAAYYMAHAIRNRAMVEQVGLTGSLSYAFTTLFYFLARDSVSAEEAGQFGSAISRAFGAKRIGIAAQLKYYNGLDFWVLAELQDAVISRTLETFEEYFEHSDYRTHWQIVNEEGKRKLESDFPEIAKKVAAGVPF